jgi:hypothetical protein
MKRDKKKWAEPEDAKQEIPAKKKRVTIAIAWSFKKWTLRIRGREVLNHMPPFISPLDRTQMSLI